MPEKDLSPAELAATVKQFLDAVVAAASSAENPLLDRIRAHLGWAPNQLPVIAEEFETFEHPNVQVALEAYIAADGRQAELLGIAAPNKRFMGLNLSDFLGGVPRARDLPLPRAVRDGPAVADRVPFAA